MGPLTSHDARMSVAASGALETFNRLGLISASEVQVARTLGRLARETDQDVLVAAALTVRALSGGSVCVDISGVEESMAALPTIESDADIPAGAGPSPFPDPQTWLERLRASAMVAVGQEAADNTRPLRLLGSTLYLERYWLEEERVRTGLEARATQPGPVVDEAALTLALDRWAPDAVAAPGGGDLQRRAIENAVRGWTSVLAGGPGTGKTTAVAAILATIAAQSPRPLRCALAAPTGKAAARLQEAFTGALSRLVDLPPNLEVGPASTLHRLLGARGPGSDWTHGADNPLPHDVVVVDEMSMVALPMMARLLSALAPTTRLLMVGDPHQLTAVEAGAVLADIVAADPRLSWDSGPRAAAPSAVTVLQHSWRFAGDIAELAEAIRRGDSDTAVEVLNGSHEVTITDTDPRLVSLDDPSPLRSRVLDAGRTLITAANDGDARAALAALTRHRLLCAHRVGRYGVSWWEQRSERLLRNELPGIGSGEWYVGRPLLLTANSLSIGLHNGDTGVVIDSADGPIAALETGEAEPKLVPPFLLDQVQTLYAMTVHKSQGSQFGQVSVILPPPDSPLLTRDLIYTAITRAQQGVHLIGTVDSLVTAIRTPSRRASGLATRLR